MFRRATGLQETETLLLRGSCRISQALRPKAETVIRKDPGSDPLADLGETQEEVGEIGTCTGDTDIGSSHFSEFILTQAHLCW